jgi:hypothetical protein
MPKDEWESCTLLLCERKELASKILYCATFAACVIREPQGIEHREQQQRIFGGLSTCFCSFDQKTCPLNSLFGFRRGIPFDVNKRRYERDLQLDLFAAQRGSGWQSCYLAQGTRKLLRSFD